VEIKKYGLVVYADNPDTIFTEITQCNPEVRHTAVATKTVSAFTRDEYISAVKALQHHIHRGDCYEINFCLEYFSEEAAFDPFAGYQKLAAVSPNPFSAFYRVGDRYLLCASPERFLAKNGNRVFSQPIKGTSKRNIQNKEEDNRLKEALRYSQKEQSENVMVVDLVRNDLTRICKEASVKVDELYGVYSYPQVHQMISTISGELKENLPFSEIIRATFPMGSMTGAPKHRVMQLIEEYEPSARGIFSGAVGYFHPSGDFDFNVVIRSIMYNSSNQYLSYQVGSAITFYSSAEQEWEECLLKAQAIRKVLEG
jgi:para-aminobenzoate synthetase component 1